MAVIGRGEEQLPEGAVVVGPDDVNDNWIQEVRARRIAQQRATAERAGLPFDEDLILPGEHEEFTP